MPALKSVNSEANARRITMVENCFGSSGQPLKVPGRVLVGEGVLTKICRKKPKPRQFFLFNDILVYGTILINKKKYNQQHLIPLEDVKLENLQDDGHLRNGWLIRTSQKSFAVYAATATEKSEWMAHLNKCIQDLLKKSGKRPTTEHAAVWIPDSDATVCMHCKKTMFNVLNRRHHCRKCGAVVCGPCSSKKLLLPSQSSKPLRVCLSCFDSSSKTNESPKVEAEVKPVMQDSSDDDSDNEAEVEGNLEINVESQNTLFYEDSEIPAKSGPPKRPPPPQRASLDIADKEKPSENNSSDKSENDEPSAEESKANPEMKYDSKQESQSNTDDKAKEEVSEPKAEDVSTKNEVRNYESTKENYAESSSVTDSGTGNTFNDGE